MENYNYNNKIYKVLWIRNKNYEFTYDLVKIINQYSEQLFGIKQNQLKKLQTLQNKFKIGKKITFINQNTDKIENGVITNIFSTYYLIDNQKYCFSKNLNIKNYINHKFLIGTYVYYDNEKYLINDYNNIKNTYSITNYEILLDFINEQKLSLII